MSDLKMSESTPERTWETRSQAVAAEPGREFAWEVNEGWLGTISSVQPDR